MKMKVLLGVLVAIIVVAGVGYWYMQKDAHTPMVGQVSATADGWSRYTNPETKFAFSYPSNWTLQEKLFTEKQPEGSVASVLVQGDGYGVHFYAIGKEYPGGVTTKTIHYTVSGKSVTGYEDANKDNAGFMQGLNVCGGSLVIISEDKSKTITDKIIASVQCSE